MSESSPAGAWKAALVERWKTSLEEVLRRGGFDAAADALEQRDRELQYEMVAAYEADENELLDRLTYEMRLVRRTLDQVRENQSARAEGWTVIEDGSWAKALPDGRVVSTAGMGHVARWELPSAERHRAAVVKFKEYQTILKEQEVARSRRPAPAPVARPRLRTRCRARAPRRVTRSSARSGDSGDGGSEGGAAPPPEAAPIPSPIGSSTSRRNSTLPARSLGTWPTSSWRRLSRARASRWPSRSPDDGRPPRRDARVHRPLRRPA